MSDTEKQLISQDSAALPSAGTPTEVVSADKVTDPVKVAKNIIEVASQASLKMQHELVKSLLPVGAFRTDDHRYYLNGEGPVPSVTTVLEILDKPALSTWKAQQAVKALYRETHGLPENDWTEDEAVKWALAEVRKNRDGAASIGSGVHHLADMASRASGSDSKAFQVSDEEKPYLDAFNAFTEAYSRSSFVSSEKMVWSLNGYAGTYDLLMMIDGELWLLDIKTGKRIDYPEYALQLAAYRWADWIILEGDPRTFDMPDVQRTGILHLRPDTYKAGYCLYEVSTTYDLDFITFLGLLEAYKWKQLQRKPLPISP